MVMKGETIAMGAPWICPDCKTVPVLGVYKSGAGWYIGTYCNCGPYSRESDYYHSKEICEQHFAEKDWNPRC